MTADVEFLRKKGLMDYSLLVAIESKDYQENLTLQDAPFDSFIE